MNGELTSLRIEAGRGKDGLPEPVEALDLHPGDVVCLLGATGAGKTQLLNDLGVLACGDTPTGRRVLVNGRVPDEEERYALSGCLVAQLSQNMHFVMDMPVHDFLVMHAGCRDGEDPEDLACRTLACANTLAGEFIAGDAALTSLSGGQSRALMVADVALVSAAPVVLLDEIENAGIDKHRAIELLVKQGKIAVMSTHDPVLALSGQRRVIVENGKMSAVITTSDAERENLERLRRVDEMLADVRSRLRAGQRIEEPVAAL